MNKYYFVHSEWCDNCIFDYNNNIIYREYHNEEKGIFKFNNNRLIINWDNWLGDDIFIEINNIYYHIKIFNDKIDFIRYINVYDNIDEKIQLLLDNNNIYKFNINIDQNIYNNISFDKNSIEINYIGYYKFYNKYLFIYNDSNAICQYVELENIYYNCNILKLHIENILNLSNINFEKELLSDSNLEQSENKELFTREQHSIVNSSSKKILVKNVFSSNGVLENNVFSSTGVLENNVFLSNGVLENNVSYKIEKFKKINNSYYFINEKIFKYKIGNINFNESMLKNNLSIFLKNNIDKNINSEHESSLLFEYSKEKILLNKNYIDIDNINRYIKNKNNNLLEKCINIELNFEIPLKKNKRILSLVEWGFPPFGGGENWLLDLNKIFYKNNIDNYLICFSDPFKNEYFNSINYIDLKYVKIIQMPKDLFLIIKIIKIIDPDIINHQGVYRELFMKISNVLEIPFLTGFCFWNDIVKFNIPNFNVGMINNNLLEKTDIFKIINDNSYTYVSSHFVNDIINNLYNTKLDVIETISFKDNYIINQNEQNNQIYVTIINCHYNKGGFLIKYLCDNLNHDIPLQLIYTENDPDIPFSYVEDLINYRNTFNNKNVVINGKIDIKNVYSKTKILLIPSICDETFCRVAYEGMMNNIPIISTKNGNLKYLLENYALFIESHDCNIWKNEIENLYFSNNLIKNKDLLNSVNSRENNIETQIMNKLSTIKESKYKLNNNNIGLIIPWADQGLGIQSRDYYISLTELGYNPYVLSFKPYHATHENIRLQTNKEEWNYKNIEYSKICASASKIDLLLPELLHFAKNKIWKLVGGNFIMLASL